MSFPSFGSAASFGPASYPDGAPFREEIIVQAPPSMPKAGAGAGAQMVPYLLFPLLGAGSMSVFLFRGSGGPLMWIVGGVSALGMVAMLVFTLVRSGSQKKVQINDERRDYLRYLRSLRERVHGVADRQATQTHQEWPAPGDLWLLAGTDRMWQRWPGDPNFARVRLASGPQLLGNPLSVPETAPLEDLDPVSSASLRRFLRAFATVPGLPVTVSLRAFTRVAISGERPAALGLARSIVLQLATYHAPGVMRIVCCLSRHRLAEWDWLKWLPHAADATHPDGAGAGRLGAGSLGELATLLGDDLGERGPFVRDQAGEQDRPHILVVLDGGDRTAHPSLDPVAGSAGVTFVDLGGGVPAPTGPATLDLVVEGARVGRRRFDAVTHLGTPDGIDAPTAEFAARQLAALGTSVWATPDAAVPTGPVALADLLGLGDPRSIDPAVTWRRRSARDRLRIPIGVDPDGRPVDLDLKESAEGGMGPHGLVIGATGSGKSELLRTLVTALAVTHSSETLNLALVDFKGGATFAGMASLPHTCAVITNLSDELTLVDRMGDALRGEMVRRQELLRSAGNFASVRDYERQREAGAPLPALPSLLVIIDEFSELLSERPELTDLFVMIGRLGRSLAIHLLFASQRLEEGRLRGLDSHLSYRIGLRTFSASESRAVLGVPDAYELPPVPGAGFLKMDTATLVRFKSAYVSGDLPVPRIPGERPDPASSAPDLVRFTLAPVAAQPVVATADPPPRPAPVEGDVPGQTVMGTMLSRLEGRGPAAHQIWLPPLADPPSIDQLLPGLRETAGRGYGLEGWAGNGRLTALVAIVDKPFEQRRDLLWADLSGAAGHGVVVGAPQSGKSTLLRTLVLTLALTHTPTEVQFFVLDFGGGGLAAMSGLPHVSGAAGRLDADRCRRIVAELTGLLDERERTFAERGIDSMAAFRAAPFSASDGRHYGDVFLVVDGWMLLRQEFEDLEEGITMLAARGLGYGIHVILSANRWMEVRSAVRDLIGTQFELRLGDPSDSAIDRKAAANVPAGVPGRGLTADKLQFLTALPRVDGRQTGGDLAAGVADAVKRIDAAWRGTRAPQVRLLPTTVPIETLPGPIAGERRFPIGIAETDLKPVHLDFTTDPHLLAFGDIESGKSGLLRLVARQIMARYSADEALISVVDYRRSLLGVVPKPYLLDYCGSEEALVEAVGQVDAAMRTRLPGPDVTPEQLRDRSWWRGPELFLLVDDYDLVSTSNANPLAQLAPFLAQARDIGLHLVVVRRTGGASRAMYEPLLQRMRDVASPGLQLSGSRDEGALVGDVKLGPKPPGRGHLVTRREGARLIQLAWSPPTTA